MKQIPFQLQQAIEHQRAGQFDEAERACRQILDAEPGQADAGLLLGTVLLQQERFSDSVATLEEVAEQCPDSADVQNNLGIGYKALGRRNEAAEAFKRALHIDGTYSQAWYNLGCLMAEAGYYEHSEKCLREALEQTEPHAQLCRRLADVLNAQGKWADAESMYGRALELEPESLGVLVNLGFVLVQQEKLDAATDIFHRILEQKPDYCEIHNNLSYVAERQGRFAEAIDHARRALELRSDYAEAWNNWGVALRSMHQLQEACERFHQALEVQPDFALASFNLGTTHLLAGDYRAGWSGYEQRLEAAGKQARPFEQPVWQGQPIPGKRLLVHADQGFGDTIQFVRFLPQIRARSEATIVLESQRELVRLFSGLSCTDEVIAYGDDLPSTDFHVPLASLPGLLNVELESLPNQVPYVIVPDGLSNQLQERFDDARSGFVKVGIVWQGNPAQARDRQRSLPLTEWLPLAKVPNVTFFSLQTSELAVEQVAALAEQWSLVELGSRIHDFGDTAAVLEQLDLVITVDTATAHLAGALGHPVWTLLGHTPDWRWHLQRPDSPWYPTMRLYRQPTWGDWKPVITQVGEELRRLTESTATR